MAKRLVSLLLVLMMFSVAALAEGETEYAYQGFVDQPTTLSIYVPDPGTMWESWGEDPVSQRITELTGISFEAVAPVTDDDNKLSLLIAGDDLPDVVVGYYADTMWSTLESNGLLANLKELSTQYAPQVLDLINDEAWEFYANDDGNVYHIGYIRSPEDQQWFLDNNALIQTNQPVILMRQDYYDEIGNPEITSVEEFTDALREIKELHPDKIPFYTGGLTSSGPSYLRYFFGTGIYYLSEDGTVSMSYRNPDYLDMYIWMNKWANEGLITKDSFVDSSEEKDSKTMQGLVASYAWTLGETGKIPADNTDTIYYPMKPWETYDQERTNGGWQSFSISTKSENKERAMHILEFGHTTLGAQTMCWGIEGATPEDGGEWSGDPVNGPHFYFDENGKATHYVGFAEARNADWSGMERNSGIGYYQSYLCFNTVYINQAELSASDLLPTMNEWYSDYVSYNNRFLFIFPSGDDVAVARQKINDLIAEYNVSMTFAADEAEVRALYDEFLVKVEAAGEDVFNAFLTEKYLENIN